MIGDRIFLRPIISSDLASLNKWKNDEEVFKFLGGGYATASLDHHSRWMDQLWIGYT